MRTTLIAGRRVTRRGERSRGLSRMETSRSKTIGNHPGTTCANYFAKQFLAIVTAAAAARVVRPLRYWFDRVVTMSRDNASPFRPQCRMSRHVSWTSVSRNHTGDLHIQLFVLDTAGADWPSRPNFFPDERANGNFANVREICTYQSYYAICITYQVCKCQDVTCPMGYQAWKRR